MHISDTLSRLQNITDTPDNKDVIPLNFLQHLTPNYIEHAYSHLVENSYVHKTKSLDTTQVKSSVVDHPKQSQKIQIQTWKIQQLQLFVLHNPVKLLKFQAMT